MKNKIIKVERKAVSKIDDESISCTGNQLISIIKSFGERPYNYHWYVADVSVNVSLPANLIESNKNLVKIGKM
jgi:hypothetical protein